MRKRRTALLLAVSMMFTGNISALAADTQADIVEGPEMEISLAGSPDHSISNVHVIDRFELNVKKSSSVMGADPNIEPPIPNWFTFRADTAGLYQIQFWSDGIGEGCVGLYRLTADGKGINYDSNKLWKDRKTMLFKAGTNETCYLNIGQYGFGPIYFSAEVKKVTVGTSLKDSEGKAVYTITGMNSKGGTVTYTKPASPSPKLKIPETVKIAGQSYRVTAIAGNALKGKKLKSVTIPAGVTKIGAKAFYGCINLKTITIKSKALKSIGKNAFKSIPDDAVFQVPKAKMKAYTRLLKKAGMKQVAMEAIEE